MKNRSPTLEQSREVKRRTLIVMISGLTTAMFIILVVVGVEILTGSHTNVYLTLLVVTLGLPYLILLVRYWRCPVCNRSFFLTASRPRYCRACHSSFECSPF